MGLFKLKRENPAFMEQTMAALKESNIKAIVQAFQFPASEQVNTDRLYFVNQIPYGYIFPKVRGVVHHGGCTTNGIAEAISAIEEYVQQQA